MRRLALIAFGVVLVPALTGCQSIPQDAPVATFCSSGEQFSASTKFDQGVRAAKHLAEVGTPKGIDPDARAGFVELINRVTGARDGNDFIKSSKKLTTEEQKHLSALGEYIQKTCVAKPAS